jgi:hypothetical protein
MLVLSVDATSRVYDLWSLAFGTAAINTNAGPNEAMRGFRFFVTMKADGNDVYYVFGQNGSIVVDDTAAVAAGGTPAFTANAADVIFASQKEDEYLDRGTDRYLAVKCAAGKTAKLRIRVSCYSTNMNSGTV